MFIFNYAFNSFLCNNFHGKPGGQILKELPCQEQLHTLGLQHINEEPMQ